MKRPMMYRPWSLFCPSHQTRLLALSGLVLISFAWTKSVFADTPLTTETHSDPHDAVPSLSVAAPTSWSLYATVGIQALGFSPTPVNPQAAIGADVGLFKKGIYQFRLGTELGYFHQHEFSDGVTLDVPLVNRLSTPWGLYVDLNVLVGGGVSWLNTPSYRRADDGQYERQAPPPHPHARLGLGAALGYDLSHVGLTPVRVFVSYRQLALTPFMRKNDVPLMGLAAVALGFAVEMN